MKFSVKTTFLALSMLASSAALADTTQFFSDNPGEGSPPAYETAYVGANFGAAWVNQSSFSGSNLPSVKLKYKTGYTGSVEFGYYVWQGLAAEVQASYLSLGNKHLVVSGISRSASGTSYAWYGMVNAVYHFKMGNSGFEPLLGVGAGALNANTHTHDSANDSVSGNLTNFAYQGIVGVGYKFTPNWMLSLRYNYVRASSSSQYHVKANGVSNNRGAPFAANVVTLGVAYTFGM